MMSVRVAVSWTFGLLQQESPCLSRLSVGVDVAIAHTPLNSSSIVEHLAKHAMRRLATFQHAVCILGESPVVAHFWVIEVMRSLQPRGHHCRVTVYPRANI